MSTNDPHFKIRMPAPLKARLEEAASASNRSLTAEIVWRLTRSFPIDAETAQLVLTRDKTRVASEVGTPGEVLTTLLQLRSAELKDMEALVSRVSTGDLLGLAELVRTIEAEGSASKTKLALEAAPALKKQRSSRTSK